MTPLGKIVHLQIQRASLKTGEKPNRIYDPAPLLAVQSLTLTPHGAEAHLPDGSVLLDIHNARHPETKNSENENALSIGFTHHYELMRRRFGEHVPLGCGGENIIVETERRIELSEVAGGLVIQTADGALVRLENVRVAEPCRPFAGYLLGRQVDGDTLKAGVQFLQAGMRGYYLRLAGDAPATVRLGDAVFTQP
ncbi:MAG: MOSC domain-containing protein [Anaerolineales bacterium]|nr:MOSC domain-containing protein [Anaerolineales bacterium]